MKYLFAVYLVVVIFLPCFIFSLILGALYMLWHFKWRAFEDGAVYLDEKTGWTDALENICNTSFKQNNNGNKKA